MKYPVQEAAREFLRWQYGDEQDIPLAYLDVIEVAFSDALCDVPPLEQWSADRFYEQEPA